MFADTHLMDVTRLNTLGQPLPHIFFAVPFLYLLTLASAACLPFTDLLTSNKPSTTPTNPRPDRNLLLGIVAGTYVLWQSTLPDAVWLSLRLFYSAFAHRPL